MKRRKTEWILLAGTLLLIVLFSYLESVRKSTKETVMLRIRIMNNLQNEEHVLKEFEERTFDTLGIKIDLKSQSPDAYKKNLTNLLRTQNSIDLVFDGPWLNMNQHIAEGLYVDLEPYMESGNYPGLEAAFSKRYLDDSRINGRLYGLPIIKNFYDPPGIIYRKDLLESYRLGFDMITDISQLQMFYEAVREKNPEMIPLSVGSRGFYNLLTEDALELQKKKIYDISGISLPAFPAKAVLSEDQREVRNVIFLGDSEEQLKKAGDGVRDYFQESYLKHAQWNSYLSEDSLMSSDSSWRLLNGTAASWENTLGEGTISLEDTLKERIPEGKLAFFPADTSLQKLSGEEEVGKGLSAWNYICIPSASRHIEETLKFLDWLFCSQENNDLFNYGVEGVDWKDAGDREYELLGDSKTRYDIPGYTLCYHPSYLRYETRLNENEKELIVLMADPDKFIGSPLEGFGVDYGKFSSRWKELLELYHEYHIQFMHGTYREETQKTIEEFRRRAEKLGLEEMRREIMEQIQEFLDGRRE